VRLLIDGYNLMHAVNLPAAKVRPGLLHRYRRRFLNELAARLDSDLASKTVVVFDAAAAPPHLPREEGWQGMTILYATEDEGADARIEELIAHESAPRALTVVSSDHRVREAARRRRATVVGADEFWTRLQFPPSPESAPIPDRPSTPPVSADEQEFWLRTFEGALDISEAREAPASTNFAPTAEDIARIEREVDEEFRRRDRDD
jgi:predicted RNA-binding protein with PIN domain